MPILLFADYRSLIIQDYKKKKISNELPLRLSQSTPGNLKEECIAVCRERFQRKDEMVLRSFFGQADGMKAYLKAIEDCKTDKFKPLDNFLKGVTSNTEDKNIELLAWLINFEPRPYKLGERYDVPPAEPIEALSLEVQNPVIDKAPKFDPEPHTQLDLEKEGKYRSQQNVSGKQKGYAKIRMAGIAILVLILVGLASYWIWDTGSGQCMYWAGDHYEQIPCAPKPDDSLVVALDAKKKNRFKRITDLSSINKKSIGKVWYVKVNDTIEFYTSDGFHPTAPQLRLKPITKYIIDKYVLK